MEHISLYKKGCIAFTYEEPEVINTPLINDSSIVQYLQESIKLERAYSIRDLIMTLKAYPELQKVHGFAEELIEISETTNLLNRNHRLNYLSFEYIHELYYRDECVSRTETYTNISVYSGMANDIEEDILNYGIQDIIDLPIIIRSGVEREDDMERVYIDKVSFLCFIYEVVDYLSLMSVSANTDSQAA